MFPHESHLLALILWPRPVMFLTQKLASSGMNVIAKWPIATPQANLLPPHTTQERWCGGGSLVSVSAHAAPPYSASQTKSPTCCVL